MQSGFNLYIPFPEMFFENLVWSTSRAVIGCNAIISAFLYLSIGDYPLVGSLYIPFKAEQDDDSPRLKLRTAITQILDPL